MSRNAASSAVRKPAPATEAQKQGKARAAKLAAADATPVASHVHDLQDLIARRLDAPPADKWSARATVGFVLLVCGGFWAGAFFVARLLLH
jgi:hypothetical protein